MYKTKIYFISLCMVMMAACDHSSAPKQGCTDSSECPADAPVCNTETGRCEPENTPVENKCKSSDECGKNSDNKPVCDTRTGKCVECLLNDDCADGGRPRCIPETETCEMASYGKKACQSDDDCTDSFYSKCNTDIHECTHPCAADPDCRICRENEKCLDSDVPVCNQMKQRCEAYSDCTINSFMPCYTVCSEENDEYFAWLNGNLINKKCKDKSCAVGERKVGTEPDACEPYSTPPESCSADTSAALCSPNGQAVWICDGESHVYLTESCGTDEHCVQCQERAACLPTANCAKDSAKSCNAVCNAAGDGYYMWESNAEAVRLHVCPKNDCIHVCGTAECRSGTGYHADEHCGDSFKYCTSDGAFAFACEGGTVVQKTCANNDCTYDAEKNEITGCGEGE